MLPSVTLCIMNISREYIWFTRPRSHSCTCASVKAWEMNFWHISRKDRTDKGEISLNICRIFKQCLCVCACTCVCVQSRQISTTRCRAQRGCWVPSRISEHLVMAQGWSQDCWFQDVNNSEPPFIWSLLVFVRHTVAWLPGGCQHLLNGISGPMG